MSSCNKIISFSKYQECVEFYIAAKNWSKSVGTYPQMQIPTGFLCRKCTRDIINFLYFILIFTSSKTNIRSIDEMAPERHLILQQHKRNIEIMVVKLRK